MIKFYGTYICTFLSVQEKHLHDIDFDFCILSSWYMFPYRNWKSFLANYLCRLLILLIEQFFFSFSSFVCLKLGLTLVFCKFESYRICDFSFKIEKCWCTILFLCSKRKKKNWKFFEMAEDTKLYSVSNIISPDKRVIYFADVRQMILLWNWNMYVCWVDVGHKPL